MVSNFGALVSLNRQSAFFENFGQTSVARFPGTPVGEIRLYGVYIINM
jgi:hypothetical protein